MGGPYQGNLVPAGAAVSAGYTYREFRRNGAAQGTAVTVLLLSGVLLSNFARPRRP